MTLKYDDTEVAHLLRLYKKNLGNCREGGEGGGGGEGGRILATTVRSGAGGRRMLKLPFVFFLFNYVSRVIPNCAGVFAGDYRQLQSV